MFKIPRGFSVYPSIVYHHLFIFINKDDSLVSEHIFDHVLTNFHKYYAVVAAL